MALLLEVVIGLGVFAVALLLIMGVFTLSHQSTTGSKNLAAASDLAREAMEQTLASDYGTVVTQAPVDIPIPSTVNGVETSTVFRVQVTVTEEGPGAPPNDFARKRVLVEVSWREGTGATRSTQLESYVVG